MFEIARMSRVCFAISIVVLGLELGNAQAGPATPSLWPKTRSFSATCDYAGESRRYDTHYTIDGELIPGHWSNDDKFLDLKGAWEVFNYTYGNDYVTLLKTNTKAQILARYSNVMVIVDPYEALNAVGVWAYAINLSIPEIVASELNAEDGPEIELNQTWTGLKAFIVTLDCEFEFSNAE